MTQFKGYFSSLQGTSYEIGRQQGRFVKAWSHLLPATVSARDTPAQRMSETTKLLDTFCPGIREEIAGFCDELEVPVSRINYYAGTYIEAGCSHCAVLPGKTSDNRTYVLRNYDLSPQLDDMRLCSTSVTGRYAHTGFSVCLFGRSEGMNEHGLCVTFSACGMPVGDAPGMRKAGARGLQFWAVVRSLLEQCRNVEQAVVLIRDMPIASNMNVIVAEPSGKAALIETFDGKKAIVATDGHDGLPYVTATNHPIVPDIESAESRKLLHSVVRRELMEQLLTGGDVITKEQLKSLVKSEYPHGLTVHNFNQMFGTLRSLLFDLNDRKVDVCFGSPLQNEWHTIQVGGTLPFEETDVYMNHRDYTPDFWAIV
ncbi:C45 family autoproteolytic acyltransferase/hydolase [Paenibacillus elgii]|uniref:C45 family autoproteolytic acyltransferase/hydolase n=1 Tax=Paenibacillus elgii TaxID=189691 RepID=UPI000248D783|nr:C45 family peptidase [Paenibacillus elgii]